MIHNDLNDFIRTNAILVSVFGERIYHEWVPQKVSTWPVLKFQQTSMQDFAEDFDDVDGLRQERIDQENYQFDVYGRKSADVISAAEVVDSVLRNFHGTMGRVNVQHTALSNSTHLGEIVGNKQVRRVSLDYVFYYNPREA